MMRSLYSAFSGLQNHQTRMDVIGNNISNVNTVGFKASRVKFQDVFSQTLQGASGASGTLGGTNPVQIGMGVGVASIDTIFTDGSLQTTGKQTDLAISGKGFFVLSDGIDQVYTRAGGFDFDTAGNFIVPGTGYKVQGWSADSTGAINTSSTAGDIKIPGGTQMAAKITTGIDYTNNLSASDAIGTTIVSSTNVYDSLGNPQKVNQTFVKESDNSWLASTAVPGSNVTAGGITKIVFNKDGVLQNVSTLTVTPIPTAAIAIPAGTTAEPVSFQLNNTLNSADKSVYTVFDKDNVPHEVQVTFTNTAPNQWSYSVSDLANPNAAELTRGTTTFDSVAGKYTNFPISFALAGTTNPITINAPSAASQKDPRGTAGGFLVAGANGFASLNALQLNCTNSPTPITATTTTAANLAALSATATTKATAASTAAAAALAAINADTAPFSTATTTAITSATTAATAAATAADAFDTAATAADAAGLAATPVDSTFTAVAAAAALAKTTANTAAAATITDAATATSFVTLTTDALTKTKAAATAANTAATAAATTTNTVTDSNGITHDLSMTFTNTGANKWSYVIHEIIPAGATAPAATTPGADVTGSVTYDPTNGYSPLAEFTGISGGTVAFTINNTATSTGGVSPDYATSTIATGTSPYTTGTTQIPLRFIPAGGADAVTLKMNMGTLTQYGGTSSVIVEQDGYAAGSLESTSINTSGMIIGQFSNGQVLSLAQVALANFNNPSGLTKTGDSLYVKSTNSGEPLIGAANTSGLGGFNSRSLEISNVDLAQQFSDMIVTQRGFQANSKIITTTDTMLEELINLKR